MDKGIWYSFPMTIAPGGQYTIIKDLPVDKFSAEKMELTRKELISERDAVAAMLN